MPKKGQKIDLSEKDWEKIKTEYVTTEISYRSLAKKYGMAYGRLQTRGFEEDWKGARASYKENLLNKSIDIICDEQANRIAKAILIGDRMLEMVEESLNQIDTMLLKTTTTTESIGTDKDGNTVNTKVASEDYTTKQVAIDRVGLRQLSAVLKDLKEIGIFRSELDRKEQEARINKLRKDAEDEQGDEEIEVVMDEEVNSYAN